MSALFVPLDGRITSQNTLSGPLNGSEVMEIVSPGNAQFGNTFQITLNTLATFFAAFPSLNTTIVTSGVVYNVKTTDTRVLINKTVGSATSVVLPLISSLLYSQPILVKDLKGDAATNPITITFSGGQLCDGLSQIVINSNYGFALINPVPGGTAWYLT